MSASVLGQLNSGVMGVGARGETSSPRAPHFGKKGKKGGKYRNDDKGTNHRVESRMEKETGMKKSKIPLDDPDKLLDKDQCASRVFVVTIAGSPRQLMEAGAAERLIAGGSDWAIKFRKMGTTVNSEREGNPNRAVVMSARIKSVQNDFPYPIMISDPDGQMRGRYYIGDRRGLFVATSGSFVFEQGIPVNLISMSVVSELSQLLGDFDDADWRNGVKIISSVSDEDSAEYIVEKGSRNPLYILLKHGEGVGIKKFKIAPTKTGVKQYQVPKDLVDKAKVWFDKRRPKVFTNLSTAKLAISRVDSESWGASFGMTSSEGASVDDSMLDMHGSLTISIEIVYRLD